MNPFLIIGSMVGGCISGIWIVYALLHYMLPADWMKEWYAMPTALTAIFFVAGFSFFCTWLASVIAEVAK